MLQQKLIKKNYCWFCFLFCPPPPNLPSVFFQNRHFIGYIIGKWLNVTGMWLASVCFCNFAPFPMLFFLTCNHDLCIYLGMDLFFDFYDFLIIPDTTTLVQGVYLLTYSLNLVTLFSKSSKNIVTRFEK